MAGGTRSYEMARRLVAMGHEVNMVTSWRENDGRKGWFVTNEAGIRVHWLPVPYGNEMGYRERIAAFLKFALGGALRAASLPADLVFATSTPLTIAIPGVWAKWRRRVPMVFEVRDLWPDVPRELGILRSRSVFWMLVKFEKWVYRNSDLIIPLTPTMADFLSGKGQSLKKLTVVPHCTKHQKDQPLGKELKKEKDFKIIYCGALGPSHGPEFLVRLAEAFRLEKLPVQITVLGKGKLMEVLRKQKIDLGLKDADIEFLGEKTKVEVSTYLSRCDGTLMTMGPSLLYRRHAVQNKFFDSLSFGKPVFANYSGWIMDIAVERGIGLILDESDLRGSACRVYRFLKSESLEKKVPQLCRSLLDENFDYDRRVVDLETAMKTAIDRKRNEKL